jgi:hypothetical protein
VISGLPIEKVDFEKGKPLRALGDRILEFLSINKGKAYMEDEIAKEIMQADGGDAVLQSLTIVGRQSVVLAALNGLIREGKIVSRKPSWSAYYMCADESSTSQSTESDESLLAAARELGIKTEGKTKEEIAKEIAERASKK